MRSVMMVQRTVSFPLSAQNNAYSCDASSTDDLLEQPTSPRSRSGSMKKNVVFADEAGLQLVTTVLFAATTAEKARDRYPRTWPPRTVMRTGNLLTAITALSAERNAGTNRLSNAIAAAAACNDHYKSMSHSASTTASAAPFVSYELLFAQQNADFEAMMRRASEQKLALENVLVNVQTARVSGYMKVKNLCPEKQVFVRFTTDGWNTFQDVPCRYVIGVPNEVIDTFTFDFQLNVPETAPLRRSTQKQPSTLLEFCLCFRPLFKCQTSSGSIIVPQEEYWDNNSGKNYAIRLVPAPKPLRNSTGKLVSKPQQSNSTDVFDLQLENWTIFAAWKHLHLSAPYW